MAALDLNTRTIQAAATHVPFNPLSKADESAIVNLAASLPLPASYYQAHRWRIHYNEKLKKHKQFKDEYIYAFTWEDARADLEILKINGDDNILAITSAGDNILTYALERPARIHAVDLNPAQNHLLELKMAALSVLPYSVVWKLFGEGKHPAFRELLLNKLSPHLSSTAFQFWLQQGPSTFSGNGLYFTGCSRHALNLVKWLFRALGLNLELDKLCNAKTLDEQRQIWRRSIRGVLLSRILSWTVIENAAFLWKALGVPAEQRNMIEADNAKQENVQPDLGLKSGHAIWEYVVNTFEPVVNQTMVGQDNHYYLLCLQGKYSRRCHPMYLTPKAHMQLSQPDAFDGLRIHTEELSEVIKELAPTNLTIAVLMDSMDWFDPMGEEAAKQIRGLNKALKIGGRVLLRSAGLNPWYIRIFEELNFSAKCVSRRLPGTCIDRYDDPANIDCTQVLTGE